MILLFSFSWIFGLILVVILWCGAAQMNFCHLVFYMVYCIYNWARAFCDLGLVIQDTIIADITITDANLLLTILIIQVIFYPIAITMSFYAYREFKGMVFDHHGSASNTLSVPRVP